jgi:hypothetical protein
MRLSSYKNNNPPETWDDFGNSSDPLAAAKSFGIALLINLVFWAIMGLLFW